MGGGASKNKQPGPSEKEVRELMDRWSADWFNGKGASHCTDDCMFNPPGSPPMPIAIMDGMMVAMHPSFPDWKPLIHGVTKDKKDPEGLTFTVLTQQCAGAMQADLPAMGPFPAVALESVPDVMKSNLNFPVEVGTYKVRMEGETLKVANGSYNGATKKVAKAATVTKEIDDIWNKKGDQSDVGFGALFGMMGVSLAPPPAADAAAPAAAE